jgi:hypothetical protein
VGEFRRMLGGRLLGGCGFGGDGEVGGDNGGVKLVSIERGGCGEHFGACLGAIGAVLSEIWAFEKTWKRDFFGIFF